MLSMLWLSAGAAPAAPPSAEAVAQTAGDLGAAAFEAREAAFQQLLDWGVAHPETLEALPSEDPDPEIRARCAEIGRRVPSERLRRELLKEAGDDLPFRQAVDDLLLLAAPEPQKLFRFAVSVGKRREEAELALKAFLAHDDVALRLAAVQMTGPLFPQGMGAAAGGGQEQATAFQGSQTTRLLLDRLKEEKDSRVRIAIFQALARREDRATAQKTILDSLEDVDPGVRGAAIQATGAFPDRAVTELLLARLDRELSADMRLQLVDALRIREDLSLDAVFEKLLSDGDQDIVRTAIRALAGRPGQSRAGRIVRLLEHDFTKVGQHWKAAAAGPPVAMIQTTILDQLAAIGERSVIPEIARFMEADSTQDEEKGVAAETILKLSGYPPGPRSDEEAIARVRTWWKEHKSDQEFKR